LPLQKTKGQQDGKRQETGRATTEGCPYKQNNQKGNHIGLPLQKKGNKTARDEPLPYEGRKHHETERANTQGRPYKQNNQKGNRIGLPYKKPKGKKTERGKKQTEQPRRGGRTNKTTNKKPNQKGNRVGVPLQKTKG